MTLNPKRFSRLRGLLLGLLSLMLLCAIPDVAQAKTPVHTVKSGENAGSIARRYGCTLKVLKRANPRDLKNVDRLRVGMRLVIPKCKAGAAIPDDSDAAPQATTTPIRRRKGRASQCRWTPKDIDTGVLKTAMKARGFHAPSKFRAFVVKTTLDKKQRKILRHDLYDYKGKATRVSGWNPASTIKLFSAISALELLYRHGFGTKTQVTFHYARGDKSFALTELYEQAVHLSKNLPHNRLVQLAGFDELNGPRGTLKRAGAAASAIVRAYETGKWTSQGQPKWLYDSPPITLKEGRKKKRIKARRGTRKLVKCYGAACTTLSDLASVMCSMMLHEQLPPGARLKLGKGRSQSPHLKLLRKSMMRKRRGKKDKVWDLLAAAFPADAGYKLFRKAGYSEGWLSENLYIYHPGSRTRWIITMAAHGGRDALSGAAETIAALIRDEAL